MPRHAHVGVGDRRALRHVHVQFSAADRIGDRPCRGLVDQLDVVERKTVIDVFRIACEFYRMRTGRERNRRSLAFQSPASF